MGKIIYNYVLKGYRDVGQIVCFGDKLYVLIKIWFYYYYQILVFIFEKKCILYDFFNKYIYECFFVLRFC